MKGRFLSLILGCVWIVTLCGCGSKPKVEIPASDVYVYVQDDVFEYIEETYGYDTYATDISVGVEEMGGEIVGATGTFRKGTVFSGSFYYELKYHPATDTVTIEEKTISVTR